MIAVITGRFFYIVRRMGHRFEREEEENGRWGRSSLYEACERTLCKLERLFTTKLGEKNA